MGPVLELAIAVTAAILAFGYSRGFVRRRLRFVNAIRNPVVPVVAAIGAAILVVPFTILPLIGTLTAGMFGLGIGLGTASGVKALRSGE